MTALSDFQALMGAELETELGLVAKAIMAVEHQASSNGMFQSSRRVIQTAEAAAEGITRYRQTVFDKWTTYLRPRLSNLTDIERLEYIETAAAALRGCIARVKSTCKSRARFNGGAEQIAQNTLDRAGARELALLTSELNLYATTPQQVPVSPVNVVTHGANSPVNVGHGTLAQSVQLGSSMTELAAALGNLLAAMDTHHHGAAPDLRQYIEEAKREAEKPQPSLLRLKGFFGAAKDAVQTFAGLSPAWDVAQRIAHSLGLLG
jgi:hypothetical protein